MTLPSILLLLCSTAAIAATPYHAMVRYANLPANAWTEALAQDKAGNVFIVGHVFAPTGRVDMFILKVDGQGRTLSSLQFVVNRHGSPVFSDQTAAAAVDAQGNLLIVGTTFSAEFPAVAPLMETGDGAAFLMKVDSQLKGIVFSAKLGGKLGWTMGGGLALDQAGNIYVGGSTASADFPVTKGAYQTAEPPLTGTPWDGTAAELLYAFVMKIAADGKSIVFSTLYGSSAARCDEDPQLCSMLKGQTRVEGVALDAAGNVVIGGRTNSNELAVTAGVAGPNCGDCGWSPEAVAGYVATFSPDGSKLLWATYIPVAAAGYYNEVWITHLAVDGAGNVYAAGVAGPGLPITAGALQSAIPATWEEAESAFVAKLGPGGKQILWCTYFGLDNFGLSGLAVATDGGVWISGASDTSGFPAGTGPVLGEDYVAEISPDATALWQIFTAPKGATEAALVLSGGAVTTLGTAGVVLGVKPGMGASLVGIGNAAAASSSNTVAPFEMVTLYGAGLGPAAATATQPVNGVLPASAAGFQVLFDGQQAPIVSAGGSEIQAMVPLAVARQDTTKIQVVTPAGTLDGPTLQVSAAAPEVFTVNDPTFLAPVAKALNQDGTVNSAANPAEPGSVVTVWAAGTGTSSFPVADGTMTADSYGGPTLALAVYTSAVIGILSAIGPGSGGPLSLEVLDAVDAPAMVAGVTQISFRLPEVISEPVNTGFELEVGGVWSDPFSLYVRANAAPTSQAARLRGLRRSRGGGLGRPSGGYRRFR